VKLNEIIENFASIYMHRKRISTKMSDVMSSADDYTWIFVSHTREASNTLFAVYKFNRPN